MSTNRLAVLLTVLSVFMGLPLDAARGNDSSASLQTGGLNFVLNDKVEMTSEDLFLSQSHVRVRYLFKNTSKQDVETLVAFPLPDIQTGEGGNYVIDAPDPINVVGFEVWVDGRKINPSVEAKASSKGVDITAILVKDHLPLTTMFPNDAARNRFYDGLRRLPEADLSELERYGAISRFKSDPDQPADINPQWTTNITFYWRQTFPAGRTVEIRHAYRPVPRYFFTDVSEIKSGGMRAKYCPDQAFLAAARAKARQGTLSGAELRFVLKTGRNWAGPIGRFTLTVGKQDPKAIVSTCFEGLRRTSNASFTSTRLNFWPKDDLGFLLLTVVKAP